MSLEDYQEFFDKGVELFRERRFFDSHEDLEEAWNRQSGPERLFTQGLIQATVACHHLQNGNVRGAVSLYQASRSKLVSFTPAFGGLRIDLLLGQLDALFGPLDAKGHPPDRIDVDDWPRPTWLAEAPLGQNDSHD